MRTYSLLLLALIAWNNTALAKEPIKGFVSRGDVINAIDGFTSNRSGYDDPNTVIKATGGPEDGPLKLGHLVDALLVQAEWRAMEPTEGKIRSNNVVDKAIDSITSWNAKNPNYPLSMKLRVFAGMYTPRWLGSDKNGKLNFCGQHKTDDVICFVKVSLRNNKNGFLASYWKDSYATKWKSFHRRMANKYDDNSLIREVSMGGCSLSNDETYWRDVADSTPNGASGVHVVRHLMNKGLTLQKDKDCLNKTQFNVMRLWKKTPVGISFNVWKDYRANGDNLIWTKNFAFTHNMMQKCVNTFGSRCLIGTNSYGNRDLDSENDSNKIAYMLKLAGTAATWHYLSSKFSFMSEPQGTYIQTEVWAALATDDKKSFVGGHENEIHVAIDRARESMKIHSAEIPKLRDLKNYDEYLEDVYLATERVQKVREDLKK